MKGALKFSEMSEEEIDACVKNGMFKDIVFDRECKLPEIFSNTTFLGCNFLDMSIFHYDFAFAKFDECCFGNCCLYSCGFASCEFIDCWFEVCEICCCDFAHAVFQRANFSNNSWWQTSLNHALVGYNSAGIAECEMFAALAAFEAARAKTIVIYDDTKKGLGDED